MLLTDWLSKFSSADPYSNLIIIQKNKKEKLNLSIEISILCLSSEDEEPEGLSLRRQEEGGEEAS